MNRRFLCECYRQDNGSNEIVSKVSEKKASKWIKDVHILHKRH